MIAAALGSKLLCEEIILQPKLVINDSVRALERP